MHKFISAIFVYLFLSLSVQADADSEINAEYFYKKSIESEESGNFDEAYDLMKKAYDLDESYWMQLKWQNIRIDEKTRESHKNFIDDFQNLKANFLEEYKAFLIAYVKMFDFIKYKFEIEEVHHGSGWQEDFNILINKENRKIETLILSVLKKEFSYSKNIQSYENNEQELNIIYDELMLYLQTDPFKYKYPYPAYVININYEGVKNSQMAWIRYRNAFSEYLYSIDKTYSQNMWKSYFTKTRLDGLNYMLNLEMNLKK